MEINLEKKLIIYFTSLKDNLLSQYNNFIYTTLVNEYNNNIQELGKILNLNLKDYELTESDKYFDPADTGFFIIEGFIPITDSTSDISIPKIEDKFRKDTLLQKLIQILYIINEKYKK